MGLNAEICFIHQIFSKFLKMKQKEKCPLDVPTTKFLLDPIKTYDIVWDESNSRSDN